MARFFNISSSFCRRGLLPGAVLAAASCGALANDSIPPGVNPDSPLCGLEGSAEAIFAAGGGDFAPYYVASNNHGILTQSKDALLRLSLKRDVQPQRRFSYGYGVDFLTGYTSSTPYDVYRDNGWQVRDEHPSRIWLQQLYGEVRYRGVFLTAGMKEHTSALLSPTLSSGDLVESGNSRPIPEVRIGFNDFQDIPFTNGWVQIQGEISYGKMTDYGWLENHFNYYSSHINKGAIYTYKRAYFRTKPSQPFSATFGMQVGAFFGGTTHYYDAGKYQYSATYSKAFKQFFKMLIPTDGNTQAYYSGSSLGSWDIMLRYRLHNGATLKAYLQKPWEDGSGIGFLNGFDGIWGLQFTAASKGPVSGAVVEYLDFTNQSGPMHWDPDDSPGADIPTRAEGADDYYNNHEYNAYANYGMAIGSPFMMSPIYNQNGYPMFAANRVRGFHIGVEGRIVTGVDYRMLGGYRRAWGNGYIPMLAPRDDTSMMLECTWSPARIAGLSVKAALAFDHGELYGNHFGAMLSVGYRGLLKL